MRWIENPSAEAETMNIRHIMSSAPLLLRIRLPLGKIVPEEKTNEITAVPENSIKFVNCLSKKIYGKP